MISAAQINRIKAWQRRPQKGMDENNGSPEGVIVRFANSVRTGRLAMEFLKRQWPAIALGLATILLIAPLWSVTSPAMPDYPAHLAGFHMIADAGGGDAWSKYYFIHWLLVPNLASELIVPPLAHLLPLEAATKLFLSLGVAMWVLGPAAIQYALFRKTTALPLAAAFFAYNSPFLWGFFNFFFAAGCGFLAIAAWIWMQNAKIAHRAALFTVIFSLLYVFHLFALLTALLIVGCYEISRAVADRAWSAKALAWRALPIAAAILPTLAAFLFFKPTGAEENVLAFNIMDTLQDRIEAAIGYYFDGPALTLTGILIGFWFAGVLSGFFRVHKLMIFPLIVLALATLFAPEWAMGGWGGHLRLPAILGTVMFASSMPTLSEGRTRILAGFILAGLTVSAVKLAIDWTDYDVQYTEFRNDIKNLPAGTKIVTVLDSNALSDTSDQPYWHMAEFAIVDRDAFTPLMFTTKGQHVVQLKPPYDRLAAATAQQGSPPDVTELDYLAEGRTDLDPEIDEYYPYLKGFQCHFNVAVIVRGESDASEQTDPDVLPKFLSLRKSGKFFSLYDIHPTKDCPKS